MSSEIYESKKAAEKGIESVRKNTATEKRFEKREAKNDAVRGAVATWRLLNAHNSEASGRYRSLYCTG